MPWLIAAILAANLSQPLASPQQVAHDALAGKWGPLAPWQEEGYALIAAGKAERKVAWITYYLSGESGCDNVTASGQPTIEGKTASMLGLRFPSKKHPDRRWGYALVSLPKGFTLRRIEDTGSSANQGRAERKGAQTWIDLYTTDWGKQNTTYVRPVWVTRRAT